MLPRYRPCARLAGLFKWHQNQHHLHSKPVFSLQSSRAFCTPLASQTFLKTPELPAPVITKTAEETPEKAAKSKRPRGKGGRKNFKRTETNSAFVDADPDTFGTLADGSEPLRTGAELLPEDDDDDPSVLVHLDRSPVRVYEKQIKTLVDERKIKEALNLFFEIQKAYGVRPTHSMFTMLIGGCGRVGYTKMAFKLFKSMRDRAMDPTPAVLTGLFNACAEAPFRELGLEKAQLLYDRIQLKGWLPSNITYHAMIKAFGRCGDIEMAFKIMDEMAAQKHAITTETFAFLLMACISDKQAGFTLGLKVMRQMLWKKIRPSIYCYNLFLRTVRECGVGPPELFQELLDSAKPKPNLSDSHGAGGKKEPKAKTLLIKARVLEDGISSTVADEPIVAEEAASEAIKEPLFTDEERLSSASSSLAVLPNLLSPSFKYKGDIVGLTEVTEAHQRLMVCGGVPGIMDHLRDMCVRPDAKTITLLLDCLPADCDSEVELIAEADKMGVKLDVDFFNMLIKRRALRGDREQARDVLELIRSRGLHPDVITFGVTALSIFSKKEGREFLDSMKAAGLRVNEETWGTLVNNACYRFNFWFLLDLMRFGEQEGIAVSTTALRSIGKADAKMRQMLLKKEKGTTSRFVTEASESGYAEFRKVYDAWLKNTKMDLPRHPWEQYEPENMRKSIAELKEEAQQKTEKT